MADTAALCIRPPAGQDWVTTRSGAFAPSSADDATRTVEMLWTTGATVRRVDWFDGKYDEQLIVDQKSVRLDRLNNGAALLDSHKAQDGVRNVLGVVERAWLDGSAGRAVVRFSERAEVESIWRDVKAGIIRNVSVGYRIHRVEKIERRDQVPLVRVVDWEPMELSLVPVAADAGAQVRAATKEAEMTLETPAPAADPAIETDALRQARAEVAGLYRSATFLKIPSATVDAMLDGGMAPDRIRTRMLELAADRDQENAIVTRITGGADYSDPDAIGRRMQGALLHRADPGRYPLPADATEFRGLSLVEMRRRLLEASGVSCRGWTPDRVLGYRQTGDWLSRGGAAFMTTSDLPGLLLGVGNRILEDAYTLAASPLRSHSRERTASDFRAITTLRAGNISPLAKVPEHAEITYGQAAETQESFRVETYAKIWAFSRQALVNDDLGSLTDWVSEMGTAAAETENGLFVTVLTAAAGAGVTLDDGTALFHANRGNLASPGTALDVTNVGLGRLAMRNQKGLGGVFPVQIAPVAIVVSPAQEVAAEKVVAELQPAVVSEANPFSGGRLRVEVEPRLSGNAWFLFSEAPAFQHAYLNAQRGPQLETKDGWDILGTEFRCVFDVGVHVRDHRFVYRNPGA